MLGFTQLMQLLTLLDRGVQELNEYQLSQLFTDQKLQEAARTRNPIRLMIGFDYPDGYGNSETLVPVNLTVLPEIQHNIKFFKNDDTQNIAENHFQNKLGIQFSMYMQVTKGMLP